jgi:hypothetical protein
MSMVITELGYGGALQNISLRNSQTGVYGTINTSSPSYPDGVAPFAMSGWYNYDQAAGGTVQIDWQYKNLGAFAGGLEILVNGISVVLVTADNTGTIYVNVGDNIDVISSAIAPFMSPLIPSACLDISDNFVNILPYTCQNGPSGAAVDFPYSYVASGNGNISAESQQF